VINLQADGSGMYSLQALWSQKREECDVVTVICANQRYAILKLELALQRVAAAGAASAGAASRSLTDIASPAIDWVALAQGMGVPGVRCSTAGELADALAAALQRSGPSLIEALLVAK
jgi:acetolactate synthase-1/2/3 large subunit